jgi:putative NIF3 family GTP cyclohydrolase 1 type 2
LKDAEGTHDGLQFQNSGTISKICNGGRRMDHDVAVYSCHLRLDAHLEIGNNACMAQLFGFTNVEQTFEYNGGMMARGFREEPSAAKHASNVIRLPAREVGQPTRSPS